MFVNTDNTNDAWTQRDLKHLWHPCTQMQDHEWLPLVPIRRGRGAWLEDFSGQRYLDCISSWWVNLFGHCHPHINAAIKQQLDQLEHVILAGFSHAPAIRLAEQLVTITPPGLDRVFLADNGSAAVEVALKMSFQYWKNLGQSRTKFVTLSNSYHGETLGALAVGDVGLYREIYSPLLLQPMVAPSPDCFTREAGESWEDHSRRQFTAMASLLQDNASDICAVIVEPLVQCAGGMRMYHPVYLSLLRNLCDQLDIHLIADEIAVGFGRTGSMFACQQADITPDFMCLSKGLTGGYLPLSAVMVSETTYQAFYAEYTSMKGFLHSHSYTGNPLACTAALATIELFSQQDVLGRNQQIAEQIMNQISELEDHPHVGEIRQTGMITAIELVADKATKKPFPWQQRRGLKVYQHALKNAMLLRPLGNVIYFMPPYIISDDEIKQMTQIARSGIDLAVK